MSKYYALHGPGALCSLRPAVVGAMASPSAGTTALHVLYVLVGAGAFGGAIGIAHSPAQAVSAAIKLPLLFLSTVALNGLAASMVSRLLGVDLGIRASLAAVLAAFAIAALLLGSVSPAMLWVLHATPVHRDYSFLLGLLVFAVGVAGVGGTLKLRALLMGLTGSHAAARRLLLVWLLLGGLTGTQLSWMLSPFVASPDLPFMWWNPDAFDGNFFEYLWRVCLATS